MKRIPIFPAAWVAIATLLMAGTPKAEMPDAGISGLKVAVEMTDGSRVLGEPAAAELKITTSIGEITVQLERTLQVVFDADHKTAVVSLVNGDHLTGAIKQETFGLQAAWAKLDLPLEQVRTITVTQHANMWSARGDFTTISNPSGPWSYGSVAKAGAKFALYPAQVHDDGHDGWKGDPAEPVVWINHSTQAACNVQPGELAQHAGASGEHAVVRWQAPKSCTVRVKGAFGAGDVGKVNVVVLHNATVLFKATETKKDEPFDLEVEVKAGDTLDFDVSAGKEGYEYGSKPLDAVISVK